MRIHPASWPSGPGLPCPLLLGPVLPGAPSVAFSTAGSQACPLGSPDPEAGYQGGCFFNLKEQKQQETSCRPCDLLSLHSHASGKASPGSTFLPPDCTSLPHPTASRPRFASTARWTEPGWKVAVTLLLLLVLTSLDCCLRPSSGKLLAALHFGDSSLSPECQGPPRFQPTLTPPGRLGVTNPET